MHRWILGTKRLHFVEIQVVGYWIVVQKYRRKLERSGVQRVDIMLPQPDLLDI